MKAPFESTEWFQDQFLKSKEKAILALINVNWRDSQGTLVIEETRTNSKLVDDYTRILKKCG